MLIFQVLVGAGVVFLCTVSPPVLLQSPALSSTVWRLCPRVFSVGLCPVLLLRFLCSALTWFLCFPLCVLVCPNGVHVVYSIELNTVFPMYCTVFSTVFPMFYSTVFPMSYSTVFPMSYSTVFHMSSSTVFPML